VLATKNVIKWDISLVCVEQQNTKKAREKIVSQSTARKALRITKFVRSRSSDKVGSAKKIAGQRKSTCYPRVKMIVS
jgi:hypothetical protein